LTGLLGPTPAGLLISSLGTAAAFAIDAASFVWSATAFWLMRGGHPQPTATTAEGAADPSPRAGLLHGIREGLRYAWGDALVRAVLVVIAAINLSFVGPSIVGAAALAHTRFSRGATALGIMLSAMGTGQWRGPWLPA